MSLQNLPQDDVCDMIDCSNWEHAAKKPYSYRKRRIITIIDEMSDSEFKRALRMSRDTYNNKLYPMFAAFFPPVGKKANTFAITPDERLKFFLFYICSKVKG